MVNGVVSVDDATMRLGLALAAVQDPAARLRLATESLGRTGANLMPLFKQGIGGMTKYFQEAHAYGLVFSKDMIDRGAEFDRQWTKVWLVIKNISYLIGNELIKYLAPVVNQFQKWIVVNRQFVASGIAAVIKSLGVYLQIVFKTVKFVADGFRYLSQEMGGVAKLSNIIAAAFGVIAGARILSGMGTLLTSWRAIALLMTGISLPMAAIGAGFVALLFIVQDLASKDSLLKEQFNTLAELAWGPAKAFDAWIDKIEKAAERLGPIADIIKMIHGMLPDFESPNQPFMLHGAAKDAREEKTQPAWMMRLKAGMRQDENAYQPGLAPRIQASQFGTPPVVQANATAKPAPGSVRYGPQTEAESRSIEINAPISITVPPGTTAGQGVSIAEDGAMKGLQKALRETRVQAVGGQAY